MPTVGGLKLENLNEGINELAGIGIMSTVITISLVIKVV